MATSWIASAVIAALIGAVAWQGPTSLLMLTVAVPSLVFAQPCRGKAALVALAYFGSVSTPIIPIAKTFLIAEAVGAWAIWLIACSLLTVPWALMWTRQTTERLWRCPLALLISALPPLGLIGWGSPLTTAGCFFPGMGALGLVMNSFVPIARGRALIALCVVALTANLLYRQPTSPKDISGINSSELHSEFLRAETARLAITSASTRLVILPEGTVPRWNEATEEFWSDAIATLKFSNRLALVGAGRSIPNSDQYLNSAILIGAITPRAFDQRVPIPLGMWKPFGQANGVPLNLFGPATLDVGAHRIGILICYEQLLVWPVVTSALEHPDLFVGLSNAAVAKGTHVPAAQEICLKAWSRLFGIPYISAIHS